MHRAFRHAAIVAVAVAAAAGCTSADEPSAQGAAPDPVSATTSPTTTAPPTTAPPTTAPPTTAAPTTEPAPPPTTEPACDDPCRPSPEERDRIAAFVDAYNDGDWDDWVALLVDDEPTWQTPVGPQNSALVRFDFEWSAGLHEVWTLGECFRRSFDISCEVTIEDDVHRALAYRGLEPSECRFSVSVAEDGRVDPVSYDAVPCHEAYDQNFHVLGGWFSEQFPDEERIVGAHYRGWNQPLPDRAARVVEVLPDFVAYLKEIAARLSEGD